jgi:hypothetical protein
MEYNVGRDLKQRIPDKQNAHAKSVYGGREREVAVHRQRREADIHAINVIGDIGGHDQRQQPPRAFLKYAITGPDCHAPPTDPVSSPIETSKLLETMRNAKLSMRPGPCSLSWPLTVLEWENR